MTASRYAPVFRPSTAFGSVAMALAIACSACSSTPSTPTVGQQFLAIVAKTDKALTKDRSVSKPGQAYPKYAVSFKQAANEFRALTFPSSMQRDARALVTALDALSADAAKVGKAAQKPQTVEANVVAMAQLNLKLMEEEKTEQTVSNALRRALGLPPPTTTTTTVPSTTAPVPLTPTPSTTKPATVTSSPAG
jgi:hypothetical protein